MKEDLINELTVTLMPYLKDVNAQDLQMRIMMALEKYEVTKAETSLTVYEGDINEQILKRFLAAKIAAGLSRRTVKYYGESIKIILEKIGKPYMDITADDIRYYLAIRVQRDMISKTTANNERRNLSAFFGWLQKEEILIRNPMAKVDAIKEQKKKKKAYSLLDLEKIRAGCRTKRENAIVEVLASTWCRVSELVQIRIDDIQNGKIIVHGKGAKDREVYLNARAELAVSTYLKERSDNNPYLLPKAKYAGDMSAFAKSRPKRMWPSWYTDPKLVDDFDHMDHSSVEGIVRAIGKRVGVQNVHPHRFRRTGATLALRQGMPLTTVSKLLGHESIATTQIYLDISDEELQQAHSKYVI